MSEKGDKIIAEIIAKAYLLREEDPEMARSILNSMKGVQCYGKGFCPTEFLAAGTGEVIAI